MEGSEPQPPASAVYTRQAVRDNTLDDAQLESRCPLDNGRHAGGSGAAADSVGELDRLPAELLAQVLLQVDVPSLTRFRRANRCAMRLVDLLPQYAALVARCPDVVRAVLSIEADAFGCGTLYATLSTSRCSTCDRFGDHLYLVDCRRACYFCFTRRPEFLPLTATQAAGHLTYSEWQQLEAVFPGQFPSVLSLPGRYCASWVGNPGNLSRKRLRLFVDLWASVRRPGSTGPRWADMAAREPRRFMAIITAPYLFDAGRRADWGYFCLGCKNVKGPSTNHYRVKYTREEMLEHLAKYGPVEDMPGIPGRFVHVSRVG